VSVLRLEGEELESNILRLSKRGLGASSVGPTRLSNRPRLYLDTVHPGLGSERAAIPSRGLVRMARLWRCEANAPHGVGRGGGAQNRRGRVAKRASTATLSVSSNLIGVMGERG
jgi:hypothetical protein